MSDAVVAIGEDEDDDDDDVYDSVIGDGKATRRDKIDSNKEYQLENLSSKASEDPVNSTLPSKGDTKSLFGGDDDDDDDEGDDDIKTGKNKQDSQDLVIVNPSRKGNKSLFGDDDDDDDDDDDNENDDDDNANEARKNLKRGSSPEKVSVQVPKIKDLFGEDDDDDDDDEGMYKDEGEGEESMSKTMLGNVRDQVKGTKKTGFSDQEDEDSDEGDVEFDDAEAEIVGLNSKTKAGAKAIQSAAANRKARQAMGEDLDVDGDKTMNDDEEDYKFAEKRDDDEELQNKPTVKIDRPMTVQNIDTRPDPKRHKLFMTKLPNILGIQSECFDPKAYQAKMDEEEFGQASFNLMRWRYKTDSDGEIVRDPSTKEPIRESNARFVEWEDGSYTLHIGTETFQVDTINTNDHKTGFPGSNGYLYLSQMATYDPIPEVGSMDTDDYSTTPGGTVLECMGSLVGRLAVRPSSLQSEAHKSLTVGIRQKTIKKQKITEIVTQEDPEKLKQDRIRVKLDLDRAEARKGGKNMSYRSYDDRDRGGGGGGGRRRPRMSRSYLEQDEDDGNYDTTDLRTMKRRTLRRDEDDDFIDDDVDDMDGYKRYDEDDDGDNSNGNDDEDEDETFHRVRPGRGSRKELKQQKQKQRALKDEDDDDDNDEEYDENNRGKSGGSLISAVKASELGGADDDEDDDDNDDFVVNKNRNAAKKRSHQALLDDDDDE